MGERSIFACYSHGMIIWRSKSWDMAIAIEVLVSVSLDDGVMISSRLNTWAIHDLSGYNAMVGRDHAHEVDE